MFKYILNKAAEDKIEYISPVFQNIEEHDFFTVIKELYILGLKFAKEHPELVKMSNRFFADKTHPVYQEVMQENMGASYSIFETLIRKSIEHKEIREDIDVKLIAYLIGTMSVQMVEYYRENECDTYDDEMMKFVDRFIDLLKNGLTSKRDTD